MSGNGSLLVASAGPSSVAADRAANARGGPRISAADSAVSAWVIPSNEELMIARHTCAQLGDGQAG